MSDQDESVVRLGLAKTRCRLVEMELAKDAARFKVESERLADEAKNTLLRQHQITNCGVVTTSRKLDRP